MPKRSMWRGAQFDPLRLRLIKIAARVVELKTQIRLHLPTACSEQAILRVVRQQAIPPGRWARELRTRSRRWVPPGGNACRQDPEGGQSGGSPRRATNGV